MSTRLSANQALEMARAFKMSALAVGQYTIVHWNRLSKAERDELNSREWSLFNASEDFINLATELELKGLERTLPGVVAATEEANRALEKVGSARKAIAVAASLVTLAGAITSRSPSAVAGGLKRVRYELRRQRGR